MKKTLRIKIMLLLFALVVGMSNAWADKYKKITSSSDLVVNAEYLLVSGTQAYSGVSSNIGQHVTVTFDSNGDITGISTAHVLRLGGSSGEWTFYDETDSKYIAYTSTATSKNNYLYQVNSNTANGATWTLSVTSSAVSMNNNYNSGRWMRYNSDRFCCYYRSGSESTTGSAVTLYKKETFTVTATVNNAAMGSVSVSGTTITAAPNTGCRVRSGDEGYTVTTGTATVTHEGTSNTLTVSPSTNCTVQVIFEEIPTHTITCVANPVGSGTFDAVSSLYEGSTTDITASANSGFKFKSWSVLGGGASLSSPSTNPTTLTMGTADVTVTATFEAVTTYAITYSVNDKTNTVNVEENKAIDLSAPSSALIPVGYVFKGWRTSTVALTDADPGGYVTSATSTEPKKYYAVWAVRKSFSPDTYEKLTSNSFNTNDTYLIGATQGGSGGDGVTMMYLQSYSSTDEDIAWGTCTSAPATNSPIKFNLSGSASSLVAKDNIGNYLTCISAKKFAMSSTSTTVYLDTDGSILSESGGNLLRYNHNNGNGGLRWYASTTGSQAYFYKVVDNCTYGSFCTTVSSISLTENVTISGDFNVNNYVLTIPTGKTLTVTGTLINTTPANLVIEDGGQLIVHNDNVQATIQKTVTASAKNPTNWYTIASPVRNVNIGAVGDAGSVNNLKAAGGEYDLYRFNETKDDVGTNLRWENYKNNAYHDSGADDFTSLETGRGYLYRREGTATLEYVGEVNGNASETYTLTVAGAAPLTGFHLIGNPYSHDIYKGTGAAIDDSKLNTGFYRLTNGTAWTAALGYGDPIHSGEGILVQANASGPLTISNSTTAASGESKSNNDNIMFSVANSQHEDVTYAVFDKGHGLNKIEHRDDNIPMLYISQNGEDYAIAMMSDDTKMFSLNFKAMTMGKYTLSYKTRGEFNYLHVIDRLTGEDVDMLLEGEYSFVASPNDNDARFIVKLAYLPDYSDGEGDIFAYQNGSDIFVSGEGELQIFDVMGRFVMSERINGVKTISADELSKGVYVLRLVGNGMKTQKIVVK